jgi:hypothetical protein
MRAAKWGIVLVAVLAGVGAGGAISAWWSVSEPAPAPAATRRVARPEARVDRAARAERRERTPVRTAPRLPPDERADIRESTRAEQTDALILEIEDHALQAGWDDALIAAVEDEVTATTRQISDDLARVDRGEVRWDDVRAAIRDERLASAARVEALLGPDRFHALADAVGLERFGGETPIRGRLDGRRADAGPPR